MADECHHCGTYNSILIPIVRKEPSHLTGEDSWYFCAHCHADYLKEYFVIATCDSCTLEFLSEDTDPPFTCVHCKRMGESQMKYNHHNNKMSKKLCVHHALSIFVGDRQHESRDVRFERAKKQFRILNFLGEDGHVASGISNEAKARELKPSDIISEYANIDRTEEGLDQLVMINRKAGMECYHARMQDAQWARMKYESYHLETYTKRTEDMLCFEADDPFAEMPF